MPLLMFGAVAGLFTLPSMCNSTKDLTADPIAELIKRYDQHTHFTVLLYDMDEVGTFNKDYKQRYRVLYDSADSYAQARSIYLQNRRFKLGSPADENVDDLYDDPYLDPYE